MSFSMMVIIATHNRNNLLRRTLSSILNVLHPSEFKGIVVIENGGQFGAEAEVAKINNLVPTRYLHATVANKSIALNLAIETVACDFVIFLDDDVRCSLQILNAYAHAAQRHGRGHYFGGPLEIDAEVEPPDWLRKYLPTSVNGWNPNIQTDTSPEANFLGGNWAAYVADIREAGGFKNTLGPGHNQSVGEDTMMQVDLKRRGARPQFVKEALVWHYVPKESVSPEWALRRAYRHAMFAGMTYTDNVPRLFGAPRWMYKEIIRRAFKAWYASYFVRSPVIRHETLHQYWSFKGWMRGATKR